MCVCVVLQRVSLSLPTLHLDPMEQPTSECTTGAQEFFLTKVGTLSLCFERIGKEDQQLFTAPQVLYFICERKVTNFRITSETR